MAATKYTRKTRHRANNKLKHGDKAIRKHMKLGGRTGSVLSRTLRQNSV